MFFFHRMKLTFDAISFINVSHIHVYIKIFFSFFLFFSTCNNLFYYGLSYNTTNMSGNEFINFFLLSITELPSTVLAWWGASYIGRRWTEAGCFLMASVCAVIAIFTLSKNMSPFFYNVILLYVFL